MSFEDVDTRLLPPRPRMYGLVGAEVIEQVWKERIANREKQPEPVKKQLVGSLA